MMICDSYKIKGAMSSSSSSSGSPCAACKFLRRKCMPGCIFAPYFPPEEPQKFASVHKVFGASNIAKLLNELLPQQREDAVNSLAYEAEARMKDPVYGCVGAISVLQRQVQRLQKELDAANADLLRYACCDIPTGLPLGPPAVYQAARIDQLGRTRNGSGSFYPTAAPSTATVPGSYSLQWAAAANNVVVVAAGESNASVGGEENQGGEENSM